jgi:ABC-type amino acid transport substrate-binding protein
MFLVAGSAWAEDLSFNLLFAFGNSSAAFLANDPIWQNEQNLAQIIFKPSGLSWTQRLVPPARYFQEIERDEHACGMRSSLASAKEHDVIWVPTFSSRFIIVARPGLDLVPDRLDSLVGYRVGTAIGSRTLKILETAGIPADATPGDGLNYQKLMSGRIDFWFTTAEAPILFARINNMPAPRVALDFGPSEVGMVCNRHVPDAVLAKLRDAIARYVENGGTEIAPLTK